jgi:hypothetical protein
MGAISRALEMRVHMSTTERERVRKEVPAKAMTHHPHYLPATARA